MFHVSVCLTVCFYLAPACGISLSRNVFLRRRRRGEQEREVVAQRAAHTAGWWERQWHDLVVVRVASNIEGVGKGDKGGARLVRAHGGEKSRAPHPPRCIRGETKEVWKGTIYPVSSLSLFLLCTVEHHYKDSFKREG